MKKNPIQLTIENRGVGLPEKPIDISPIFRTAGIKRVYVIGMTGRCGSTWLASELKAIPYGGNPLEYFSEEGMSHYGTTEKSNDIFEFLSSIVNHGRTGEVFGFKIDALRLDWLSQVIDLEASFPNELTAWIDMRRLNVVKQAFSFARAKKSGVWHKYSDQGSGLSALPEQPVSGGFSDELIWIEINRIMDAETTLERTYKLTNAIPMRIKYEELVDSKSQLLVRTFNHLFPRRIFPKENYGTPKTIKLPADVNDDSEMNFILRNAAEVNQMFLGRSCT